MSDPSPVSIANDNGEPAWQEVLADTVTPDDAGNGVEPGNMPVTVTADVDGLDVSLSWDIDFSDVGVEVLWGDSSEPTYSNSPATHTYASAGTYSASVDPYGDANPKVSTSVTVSDES